MTFRIEHALVMDTDHLPGGGGYAVAAVSPGATQAERVFVAENFGISDYLHDPANEGLTFLSVFRVPGSSRTAFVRRFSKGMRRNGTQSRIFVHTLLLEHDVLDELAYLPWLLINCPLRLGGETIFLNDDPAPLLGELPPLEWSGGMKKSEAYDQLKLRFDQFKKRAPELGLRDGANAVAAALDAVARGAAAFPQGRPWENFSLLAWSMLPPTDRMQLAWTQHDSANTAISFAVANTPAAADAVASLGAEASVSSRRLVELSTGSMEEWANVQATTARYTISLRARDLEWWLRWRDARAKLFADALAADDVLIPRLQKLAAAVRADRRDRWIDEAEVLQFLLSVVKQAVAAHANAEAAVDRWVSLFNRSGIGKVVFREPPSLELLDEAEQQLGAALVARCFLGTTDATAPVRARVAEWLLEPHRIADVPIEVLGRFIDRLAVDGSALQRNILQQVAARPGGLRRLADVLTQYRRELGEAIVFAAALAVNGDDPAAAEFIRRLLLPQLHRDETLAAKVPTSTAISIGKALHGEPEAFVELASLMPSDAGARLVADVCAWLASDPAAARKLVHEVLKASNRGDLRGVPIEELAFAAAERGEPARLWLPAALDTAARLDDAGDADQRQRFVGRVGRLPREKTALDESAVRQVIVGLQQRAERRDRAGDCLKALVRFTQPGLSSASGLPQALRAAIASGAASASAWSDVVADLLRTSPARSIPAPAAALLGTFWTHVDTAAFGAIPPVLIELLPAIAEESGEHVVAQWLPAIRKLPDSGDAERFIEALADVAPDGMLSAIDVERSWREIEHDDADAATFTRLHRALRAGGKSTERDVGTALARKTKGMSPSACATQLVAIAGDDRTLPTTRRLIESQFLMAILRKLTAEGWDEFLFNADDDVFVYGNILLTVTRELALSKADGHTRKLFEQQCRDRGRNDAVAVMRSASRGAWESASVLISKSIDRFRSEESQWK